MSVTLNCLQQFTATLADGTALKIGSKTTANTVTLTNGVKFETSLVLADNYTADTIWEAGDGGMTKFEVLLIYSDVDIALELRNEDAGAKEYILSNLQGGVWHMLTTDDIGGWPAGATRLDGSVLVDTEDFDQVDQINVQRDVADGTGDANVHLILLG